MNYLAHLFLADPDDPPADSEFLIGNLLGDFVKGRLDSDNDVVSHCSARRLAGIRLHRAVDSFTDSHPAFRRSKQRLRPELRRFGGIIVDVFYDHFLTREWASYSPTPLPQFCHSVYADLQNHYHSLPTRMQRSVRFMLATDLLQSYYDLDGVGSALAGIESKLKRPSPLRQARFDLEHNHAGLHQDFISFFPELIAYAKRHQATSIGTR